MPTIPNDLEILLRIEGPPCILQMAETFSATVLNFVYVDRSLPILSYERNNLYGTIGLFVISLIKGTLREHITENVLRSLQLPTRDNEIAAVLMKFPEMYFQTRPRGYMTMLKIIALLAIYSIFYYFRGVGRAQIYARNAVTKMLITFEDGHFIQGGGLDMLKDYADSLLRSEPQYIRAFEEGFYPW